MALLRTDPHGFAAYHCPLDQSSALIVIEDNGPVLQCPTCGHRTDEVGHGVLADGFDIIHRQWGTRGDVHAWRAMRDLLAATPTPPDPAAVRQLFVDALRDVANIDLDAVDERYQYRKDLDHGGMGGGMVDTSWWGDKGIPLLVERALTRRPAE
jgi:hypothetical protein